MSARSELRSPRDIPSRGVPSAFPKSTARNQILQGGRDRWSAARAVRPPRTCAPRQAPLPNPVPEQETTPPHQVTSGEPWAPYDRDLFYFNRAGESGRRRGWAEGPDTGNRALSLGVSLASGAARTGWGANARQRGSSRTRCGFGVPEPSEEGFGGPPRACSVDFFVGSPSRCERPVGCAAAA
jgi:hypothetical protein